MYRILFPNGPTASPAAAGCLVAGRLMLLTAAMAFVVATLAGLEIAVLRVLGIDLRPAVPNRGARVHNLSVSENGRWCVSRLAYAPDDLRTGNRTVILLHDLQHPRRTTQIRWEGSMPSRAAVASSGRLALTSGAEVFLCRDPSTSASLQRLTPTAGAVVTHVAWSPDGLHLMAVTPTMVYVWQDTGRLERSWRHGAGRPVAIRFSHDGRRLAVAGRGALLDVWDVPTGRLEQRLATPDAAPWMPAIAADLQTIAYGATDGTLQVRTAAGVRRLAQPSGGSQLLARRLAIADDGRYLAAAECMAEHFGTQHCRLRRQILVWDLHSGHVVQKVPCSEWDVQHLAFDRHQTLYACDGKQIHSWNVPRGRELWRFRCDDWVRSLSSARGPAALLGHALGHAFRSGIDSAPGVSPGALNVGTASLRRFGL